MDSHGCQVHKLVADVSLIAQERVLMVRYLDTSGYDGEPGWLLVWVEAGSAGENFKAAMW